MDEQRNLFPGEEPGFGQNLSSDRLKFLRIARITRIDYQKGKLDIQWKDNFGEHISIPLPSAFSSLRGTIKGMPEIGSLVVCGWIRQSQTLEEPIILGFIENNLDNAINYKLTRTDKVPQNLQNIAQTRTVNEQTVQNISIRQKLGYESQRSKRRKLYPGEIQAESTQGAELYLHDDVYLSDKSLDEIEIVSADKSIRFSSRQQYSQTSASRIWNGIITREPVQNEELLQPTILPNGQRVQIITESNNPFHLGGKAYTEYRIETYDQSSGSINVTEVNSGSDVTALRPSSSFILGTLVGNNKSDVQRYSKVLRPQIFGTPDDTVAKVDELECLPEEYNALAGAFQLKFNSSATISLDKQGHLFTHFPASTGQHPLGSGRSWEGNFDGSIKLVIGANTLTNRSIQLDTKGGIKETLGFDSQNQRSKETIAQKGIYTQVLAPSNDGYAYVLKTIGDVNNDIQGNYFLNVTGNYVITVNGKIQENIMGTKIENYINDKNVVYGANYKEVIIKHKESTIGAINKVTISGVETETGLPPITKDSDVDVLNITIGSRHESYTLGNFKRDLLAGDDITTVILGNIEDTIQTGDHIESIVVSGSLKETVALGNIEETVTQGDIKESVTQGNIKEDISQGNIEETIGIGDKTVTITTGDYKLNITTGKIEIKTTTGTVNIKSSTQTVDIEGLLTVTVKSGVQLNLDSPQVSIGSSPIKGGVVTGLPGFPSHHDYITGMALIGSASVSSSN